MGQLYCYLSLSDRIVIQSRLEVGDGLRQIAQILDRSAATISRAAFYRRISCRRGAASIFVQVGDCACAAQVGSGQCAMEGRTRSSARRTVATANCTYTQAYEPAHSRRGFGK